MANEELSLVKKRSFSLKINLTNNMVNIIIGLFLIYFLFFGWIVNCGIPDIQNNPQLYKPDHILFVYTNFFNFDPYYNFNPLSLNLPSFLNFVYHIPVGLTSLFILIFIGIYQSYRENFVVFAIKNNIWTVPFIIMISWIWTAINARELIFTTIGRYFSSWEGYVNLVVLLVVYTFAGVIGGWIRSLVQERESMIKLKAIESLQEQLLQKSKSESTEIQ
ncbi:MAG: hypothetical protein K9W44_09135 [Candidatus Lokiarchaeota archaeon]|nr:hypothetical protein [Candidatus Harpocratesius repetitus]